jgi:hypothetical protein
VNGKVGFIDRVGNFVIEPVFDTAWPFYGGLGRTSAQRDGKFGVIDRTGAWIFQNNYDQVNPAIQAHDYGKTLVVFGWDFKKGDRWGLLDPDGHVLLEAEFDQSIQRCDDGRLQAYKNKEWLYFKADGSPLQPPGGRLVNASCGSQPPYILKTGATYELVDAGWHPVIPLHFDAVVWVSRDARNVKLDGKWGRIGLDGHWIIEPKYDYLSTDQGVVVASVNGKRGFMRSDGSWLIEPEFDAAARRRDADTAFVMQAGATGMLKLSDRSWIIPPRPGVMCDINGVNGGIVWQRNGERALLSPTGESWIDIGAERISLQLDAGLLTFLKNGRWGLIDTAGQVILDPQFDEPAYFTPALRGIAWAKRDGRWCAIDRRGQAVAGIACTDADRENGLRHQCRVEP